jgi:hypothetical protein
MAGARRQAARIAVLAVLAAAAVIPGAPATAAGAAVVSLVGATIRYDASQGHVNKTYVDVYPLAAGGTLYRFSDVHPITTALPCALSRPPGRYQIDCRFAPSYVADVHVRLFDGDDYANIEEILPGGATTAPAVVRVEGGSGDDDLWLDHISGPAGWPDIVDGGYGDDLIVSDESDDVISGGPGRDTVSYSQRLSGVTASLAAGEGGEVYLGERDRYDGVENLEGGLYLTPVVGQDVLVGDGFANELRAYGPAVLFGLGGDDTLLAGRFDDVLIGGTEFDVCNPGEGGGRVDCEVVVAPPPRP